VKKMFDRWRVSLLSGDWEILETTRRSYIKGRPVKIFIGQYSQDQYLRTQEILLGLDSFASPSNFHLELHSQSPVSDGGLSISPLL
jgi:hypothetical protein